MPFSLFAPLAIASALSFAPSALFAQDGDKPAAQPRSGPWLELGRTELKLRNVEQKNARMSSVRLQSVGSQAVHVKKVTITGEGVTASLVQKKVRRAVESGAAVDPPLEVEPETGFRIDILCNPEGLKLGDHAAVIEIETDGNDGKALSLPIDWEIVEPQKDDDEENDAKQLAAARPRGVIIQPRTNGPPPRLDCEPNYHDFGRVMTGERVKTTFKLTNRGEGDLVLQKISKQCHCTLPRLILPDGVVPKKTLHNEENVGTLKSGEAATLEVEIDTFGMGGHGHKLVQVFSNDAANSPFPIALDIDVENPFDFTPSSVSFGGVRRGKEEKRVVRMASKADIGDFSINGYELPQPAVFDVEYRRAKPKKNEACAWEISLTVRDDVPCKEIFGKLKLEIEHVRIHGVKLDWQVRVLPDVDWIDGTSHSPETISLGIVKSGLNDKRSIILENKNPSVPYAPTSVEITSPIGSEPFQAELVPIEAGQRYELKFSVVKAPPTRAFSGEFLIRADHPTMKELRFRFTGIWSSAPAK